MNATRTFLLRAACAALIVSSGSAGAAVLYKSVAANGVIQFSDTRPENARIVEERAIPDMPSPGKAIFSQGLLSEAFENPLQTIADGTEPDTVLARANSQVDLAEHALALARRSMWRELEGLRLRSEMKSTTDEDRVAFYQRNLKIARANLMEALRRRVQ
jgi:hypothetical protein